MSEDGEASAHPARGSTAALTLGALGVVYGDIGTSPLYAMRESFEGAGHVLEVTEGNVLGILSLIVWSLVLVISIKYLVFVMRAHNRGEGGILALTSLIPTRDNPARRRVVLILIGLFGTALLYGDGMITPAISVLSAIEGTEIAAPALADWVIPISIGILVALFAVQKHGTEKVGRAFGPIMMVWFTVLGVLGVLQMVDVPQVLGALSPHHAVAFFAENRMTGFLALGSVFLVVTGGEALYADMGHFGHRPISLGWFGIVLPGLLLNYFGQGALLIANPEAIDNPFYRMAPQWGLYPMVILATAATVIASQALISGAFSLTMQAVQLGYLPRVKIVHTSAKERGQIYVPGVNWALMIACVGLVLGFRSSTQLAAAYGVAVTMTMVITTLLFYVVAREHFGWSRGWMLALCGVFLVVDLAFFGANIPKIPHGGWFPLVAGGVVFAILTTWKTGRSIVRDRTQRGRTSLEDYLEGVWDEDSPRVPGTAVYLFGIPDMAPPPLIYNHRFNKILHDQNIALSVVTEEVPRVHPVERIERIDLGGGFEKIVMRYGFMEEPRVGDDLRRLEGFEHDDTIYFLGRESVHVTAAPGMARWREHLFVFLKRNATGAVDYFHLPHDRVVEILTQVDL